MVFPVCLLSHFSLVQLFAMLWTVTHQDPLSIGFSKQEYWSGWPCPPPGDLAKPGNEPTFLISPCIGKQAIYHYCKPKPFSRRDFMKMKVILGNTKDETRSLEFYQSKIHGFVDNTMPAQPNCLNALEQNTWTLHLCLFILIIKSWVSWPFSALPDLTFYAGLLSQYKHLFSLSLLFGIYDVAEHFLLKQCVTRYVRERDGSSSQKKMNSILKAALLTLSYLLLSVFLLLSDLKRTWL